MVFDNYMNNNYSAKDLCYCIDTICDNIYDDIDISNGLYYAIKNYLIVENISILKDLEIIIQNDY